MLMRNILAALVGAVLLMDSGHAADPKPKANPKLTPEKAMAEAMTRWNQVAKGVTATGPIGKVGFTWEADHFPHPIFKGDSAEAYGAFARVLVKFLDQKGNFDFLAENNLFKAPLRYGGMKVDWTFEKLITQLAEAKAHDEATRTALKAYADKIAERAISSITPWEQIRSIPMKGGLKAFWNVSGGDTKSNNEQALAHGFEIVDMCNTYADYWGKPRQDIRAVRDNPWKKPDNFETVVKRNAVKQGGKGPIFVQDIEFDLETDADKAWANAEVRAASGASTKETFRQAYYREWASWFALPCQWAKEQFPAQQVGLYGWQPFHRDFHGVRSKDARELEQSHKIDTELWKHIDSKVDFYVASVYLFYDDPINGPGSLYYVAANVEENYKRTRQYGNKPVYAYLSLRYHPTNTKLKDQELADRYLEAIAVLPYFCGAKGVVVWGDDIADPKKKGKFAGLPILMNSLGRVADLSDKIERASLVIDEPAHVLWKEKRPLTRKLKVSDNEWIVLAANPWQGDGEQSTVDVRCGNRTVQLGIEGRHTEIYHVQSGKVKRIQLKPNP